MSVPGPCSAWIERNIRPCNRPLGGQWAELTALVRTWLALHPQAPAVTAEQWPLDTFAAGTQRAVVEEGGAALGDAAPRPGGEGPRAAHAPARPRSTATDPSRVRAGTTTRRSLRCAPPT